MLGTAPSPQVRASPCSIGTASPRPPLHDTLLWQPQRMISLCNLPSPHFFSSSPFHLRPGLQSRGCSQRGGGGRGGGLFINMKMKSVMTLSASLNSTRRARRKDGVVPTQGGHINKDGRKKKIPAVRKVLCKTAAIHQTDASQSLPRFRHIAPMCLLLGCLPSSPSLIVGGDKCHLDVSAVAVSIPGGGKAMMQL